MRDKTLPQPTQWSTYRPLPTPNVYSVIPNLNPNLFYSSNVSPAIISSGSSLLTPNTVSILGDQIIGIPPAQIQFQAVAEMQRLSIYEQLLPVNNQLFESSKGKWVCTIASGSALGSNDKVMYELRFHPQTGTTSQQRTLGLWVVENKLEKDSDGAYKRSIISSISKWLDGETIVGELAVLD